jgi:hypothetical protein
MGMVSRIEYQFSLMNTGFVYINVWTHFIIQHFNKQQIFKDTFLFLGTFTKLRKVTIGFVMCVSLSVRLSFCSDGIIRLPLDRFSWNLIFDYFSKLCLENSSFIKI